MSTNIKKQSIRWGILAISFLGMGFTMPSCPGQQAMQQQVDSLQTSEMETGRKLTALTTKTASLERDVDQMKQLMTQMANVVQAQRGALEQLEANLEALSKHPKLKKPTPPPVAAAKKH